MGMFRNAEFQQALKPGLSFTIS